MATSKKPTRSKSVKAKAKVEEAVVVEDTTKVEETSVDESVETETRKSAFIPLLLGGAVSGVIGFGAATYYFMNRPSDEAQALVQVQAALDAQQGTLGNVNSKVEELSTTLTSVKSDFGGKVSELTETVGQKDSELADALASMSGSIADFETRLTTLEKRPIAEAGGMTSEAAAAYERELRTMRDLLETQRTDIEKLAAEATARIEGVAQQAATAEQAAEETAKVTAVRVAVSKLQSALDNGGAFEATVANLADVGVEISPVLADAAKGGVPTLMELQESFPKAARAGLSASVKATTGDGAVSAIGSFFRSQVGARSLEPREGDDPDAVLSRAEAALGNDNIADAIALISALPKEGQAEMSDWVNAANMRLNAVDAVHVLANSLNGN